MSTKTENIADAFQWKPQPAAAQVVLLLLDSFYRRSAAARQSARDLHDNTGTRLIDWIDHFAVPSQEAFAARLSACGFVPEEHTGHVVWRHLDGLFPEICIHDEETWRVAVKVDSVADYLTARSVAPDSPIYGSPLGRFRKARVAREEDTELWVVERHGYRGWDLPETAPELMKAVEIHRQNFRRRRRKFEDQQAGFEHAELLAQAALDQLGAAWACELFFAAEREYWTRRNRAAQVQKARQDALGLGWANHDHHTYRSSRNHFTTLIAAFERMGLECRERFYAGKEAGWGAQILEQPEAGIVVFADVDLDPHEVSEDFAHQPLAPSEHLGTVGLWCRLHGEAFLAAGMHHLECRFDFSAARDQLQAAGIPTMPPFTDRPYLKQAFTEAEMWPVELRRIDAALAGGAINQQQAERFKRQGALGSHLEILQRDDGYKGFNQAGINEIIRDTDPRGSRA